MYQKYQLAWFKLGTSSPNKDVEAERNNLLAALKAYIDQVKGPWFLGDKFSAADVTMAPVVRRLSIVDELRGFDDSELGEKWAEYKQRLLGA